MQTIESSDKSDKGEIKAMNMTDANNKKDSGKTIESVKTTKKRHCNIKQ